MFDSKVEFNELKLTWPIYLIVSDIANVMFSYGAAQNTIYCWAALIESCTSMIHDTTKRQ